MKKQTILESTQPNIILKRFKIVKCLLLGNKTLQDISNCSKISKGPISFFLNSLEKKKIVIIEYIARESRPAMPHVGGVSVGYNEFGLADKANQYFSCQVDLWEKEPTHDSNLVKEIKELLSPIKDELFKACKIGIIETVKKIISIGYNIDIKNEFGYTALFNATEYHHTKIVELLVQNKADYNYVFWEDIDSSYYKKSPYDIALEHGYNDIIKFFLKHGANCDEAFRTAARTGNIELFKLVLPYSIKLDPKYLGKLLFIASGWEALEESNKNIFAKTNKFAAHMIDLGADVNFIGEDNKTPFYNALSYDNYELMSVLMDKGADLRVDINNNEGSLLWTLLYKQNLDLLKKAINFGININRSITSDGTTPLERAIHDGNPNIIDLLIDSGANLSKRVLFYAIENSNISLIDKIIEMGANIHNTQNLFDSIFWSKNEDVFFHLIGKGAKIDGIEKNGDSLLHKAAWGGKLKIAKYLVENGLDVNQRGAWGLTSLHWAVQRNHFAIVKLLVENGAHINVKGTADGYKRTTPISIAKNHNFKDILHYLEIKLKEQLKRK